MGRGSRVVLATVVSVALVVTIGRRVVSVWLHARGLGPRAHDVPIIPSVCRLLNISAKLAGSPVYIFLHLHLVISGRPKYQSDACAKAA